MAQTSIVQNRPFYLFGVFFELMCFTPGFWLTDSLWWRIATSFNVAIAAGLFLEGLLNPDVFRSAERMKLRYFVRIAVAMEAIIHSQLFLGEERIFDLVLITAVLFYQFNLILKHPILRWAVVLYVLSGLAIVLQQSAGIFGPKIDSFPIMYYLSLVGATLLLIFAQRRFVTELSHDIQSAQNLQASHENMVFFQRFSNKLVAHDVNNVLVMVNDASERLAENGENQMAEQLRRSVEKIFRSMKSLDLRTLALSSLQKVIDRARKDLPRVQFDISPEVSHVQIPMNENLFSGIFYNFFCNSFEAWQRRRLNYPLVIRVGYDFGSRTVIIDDNAGGFDVEGVALGLSQKIEGSYEHGIFLRSIMDPMLSSFLGINVTLERIGRGESHGGTRVRITFVQIKE